MNIKSALCDVRKSYRLLYEYQRSLLETISYIEKKLNISYEGGYPRYYGTAPNRGQGNLNDTAWNWLSMYFYEFKFKITDDNKYLSILHIADNGLFAVDHEIDPFKTDAFCDVNKSESFLFFICGNQLKREEDIQYISYYGNLFDKEDFEYVNNNPKLIIRRYELSTLSSIEMINEKMNELSSLLKQYKIKL